MSSDFTPPTPATSAIHLAVAVTAFRRAESRDERVAIAEKHKPHMLESDIARMREAFKTMKEVAP